MKPYKKLPPGTIIAVPISPHGYAYICPINSVYYWLYNFVTDRIIYSQTYFDPLNWKLPFILMRGVPQRFEIAAKWNITEMQKQVPLTWLRLSENTVRNDNLPSPYRVFCNERGNLYITEEETRHMFPERAADADDLPGFIAPFLPQMKRIHVPDSEMEPEAPPSITLPDTKPEDEPVTIEIRATPECEVHRDEVEEELDEALQNAEVGDMIGAGGGELGNWDMAVECREADLKKVLKIVRRVLKKLKMPADTELVEQRVDQEDVKHLLE